MYSARGAHFRLGASEAPGTCFYLREPFMSTKPTLQIDTREEQVPGTCPNRKCTPARPYTMPACPNVVYYGRQRVHVPATRCGRSSYP